MKEGYMPYEEIIKEQERVSRLYMLLSISASHIDCFAIQLDASKNSEKEVFMLLDYAICYDVIGERIDIISKDTAKTIILEMPRGIFCDKKKMNEDYAKILSASVEQMKHQLIIDFAELEKRRVILAFKGKTLR